MVASRASALDEQVFVTLPGGRGPTGLHPTTCVLPSLMTSATTALEPIGVPNTFTPSAFHTSAFPQDTWMHDSILGSRLCANSFSPRLSSSVRVLSGTFDDKYSGLRSLHASSSGSWIATLNSNGMRGSHCSLPSEWTMRCNTLASSSHT